MWRGAFEIDFWHALHQSEGIECLEFDCWTQWEGNGWRSNTNSPISLSLSGLECHSNIPLAALITCFICVCLWCPQNIFFVDFDLNLKNEIKCNVQMPALGNNWYSAEWEIKQSWLKGSTPPYRIHGYHNFLIVIDVARSANICRLECEIIFDENQ